MAKGDNTFTDDELELAVQAMRREADVVGRNSEVEAKIITSEIDAFMAGLRKHIPRAWKDTVLPQIMRKRKLDEHRRDPEYPEYLRLRDKFSGG